MIVFRHCGGELPFRKNLREILLDDPRLSTKGSRIDYYSMAYGALRLAVTEGDLDVGIKRRNCSRICKCLNDYKADPDWAKEVFIPRIT